MSLEENILKLEFQTTLISSLQTQKIELIKSFLPLIDACKSNKSLYELANNTLISLNVQTPQIHFFDPKVHFISSVKNIQKKEEGEILKVIKNGYYLGDDIIRYAQVIVNQKE
ncbi:Co-chaperone GrpE [Spironucleus salmonicida]|uniref:Co-chaperone GrpE n=1 Tax=Spironucleus salmonicida TaxID=348837 RepID=K7R5E5_9EUKA|nr:co-chaperone GrpE [Spironucleus salmonicida]KAH0573649.1 Co-chaperone GrpE [Spironucleus salmonicida]|eukprot:EST48567.1 Co-chaperone GrpE [Spironucleus salmonicida]